MGWSANRRERADPHPRQALARRYLPTGPEPSRHPDLDQHPHRRPTRLHRLRGPSRRRTRPLAPALHHHALEQREAPLGRLDRAHHHDPALRRAALVVHMPPHRRAGRQASSPGRCPDLRVASGLQARLPLSARDADRPRVHPRLQAARSARCRGRDRQPHLQAEGHALGRLRARDRQGRGRRGRRHGCLMAIPQEARRPLPPWLDHRPPRSCAAPRQGAASSGWPSRAHR